MYKEKYAVLRFVQQGGVYHLTMDLMEGEILLDYLKSNPRLSGGHLYRLFRETAVWLNAFHRCHVQGSYQYLSPFSIVIGGNMDIALIDFAAKSSESLLRKVQSPMIREQFLPKHQKMYQNMDIMSDLYSYGRVVLYVLQTVNPDMRYLERMKMRRIIRRCLGGRDRYKNFGSVCRDFPFAPRGKMIYAAAGIMLLAIAVGSICIRPGGGGVQEDVVLKSRKQEEPAGNHPVKKAQVEKETARNREVAGTNESKGIAGQSDDNKNEMNQVRKNEDTKAEELSKGEKIPELLQGQTAEPDLEGSIQESVKQQEPVTDIKTERILGGTGYNYDVDICASVGETGGYRKVSDVSIRKSGGDGRIGYLLQKDSQLLSEGEISETGECGKISGALYQTGSYLLKIWEISTDGTVREGSFQAKEIPMTIQ